MGTNVVWRGVFEYGDIEQGLRRSRARHPHRSSAHASLLQHAAGEQRRHRAMGRQRRAPLFLEQQFLSHHRHSVAGARRCTCAWTRCGCRPTTSAAASASRSPTIRRWRCARWPRARPTARPSSGAETRSEHMTSSAHGNERTFRDTRVALDKDGVILAVDSRHIDDCGAYPRYEPLGCVIWSQVTPATYRLKNLRIDFTQVVTNKCPVGPNRGYSRMQHLWFLERVLDICAHELNIPADEMRLRNYIQSGRVSLHHAQRLRLRLGQLSGDAEGREGADRLGQVAGRAHQGASRRPLVRNRHRHHARLRHQQLRPVADRQSAGAVLRQLAGGQRQARHLRRGHRRRRLRAARSGARDHGLAGGRRHPEHHAPSW